MTSPQVGDTAAARPTVLGIPVDVHAREAVVERIASTIIAARNRQPGVEDGVRQVVTLNPEIAMRARTDARLYAILGRAWLVVPDGIGIVLALRLAGLRVPGRVTGADLLDAVTARAARDGWRLYLLGARAGVAEEAAERLAQRHPGATFVGAFAGAPEVAGDAEACARVAAARPDVLFVAYGAPAQEMWIARNQARIGVAVAIGVGGAFDFAAGRVPRAPRVLRRVGLEWAYRLWREPWRWRRMLALPRFAAAVVVARGRCSAAPES